MKKPIYFFTLLCTAIIMTNCSEDSATDEFNNANGNVEAKLIQSISVISAQDSQENANITLTYNTNGSLNTITDGVESSIFVYNNGELSNVTGAGDNLNIEELYNSPYDAFETGNVLNYDENGNPEKIEFYEEDYDFNTNNYTTSIYTADITYDNTPNPYFYTLAAGGIIEVLDDVQLNFSINPQVPQIVQARLLLPVNNLSQIVYKNDQGEVIYTINANYVYDSENYPTSATVTAISVENSEQSTYSITFEYVN